MRLTCALRRESSPGLFLLDIMWIHLLTSQEKSEQEKHSGQIPRHVRVAEDQCAAVSVLIYLFRILQQQQQLCSLAQDFPLYSMSAASSLQNIKLAESCAFTTDSVKGACVSTNHGAAV